MAIIKDERADAIVRAIEALIDAKINDRVKYPESGAYLEVAGACDALAEAVLDVLGVI